MTYPKSRFAGVLCLLLAVLLIASGLLCGIADREGTPLSAAYAAANAEKTSLAALQTATDAAPELLTRADTLPAQVLDESKASVQAALAAQATEQSGTYDTETESGALGKAIYNASQAGAPLGDIPDAFSPVFNAELLAALTTNLTDVKRAEGAVADAYAALESIISAAQVVDPSMPPASLPTLNEAVTQELGEKKGIERYLARANNYVARSENAVANAAAIRESSGPVLETASAVLAAHPLSAGARAIFFAQSRHLDLVVYGAILLLVGGCLAFFPAWLARRWRISLFRKGTIFVFVVALLAAALHYASGDLWVMMRQGVFDTLYMTIPSTVAAYIVGLPLGVMLVITAPGHIRPNPTLNSAVGTVINFLRSIPFVILLVMLFDVTRIVMGTAIGTRSVIFPLFVSAFPYVARIVESSLNEVDRGVIEAAQSMGSTDWQIIRKVLLPEALPSLINGGAICITTILAYTAMAGSAGGDGLGKIAIAYGLNRREYDVMYISSLLLVALVQIFQIAGDILTRAVDHRKK